MALTPDQQRRMRMRRMNMLMAYAAFASVRANSAWTPEQLFLQGEQGAWYDPSDLSTMFEDAAGTIPVTAAGQAVGLILDKSRGLVLGSELVSNGTFDSNITGWVQDSGSVTWNAGGHLSATGPNGIARLPVATVSGRWYEISFTIISTVSGQVNVRAGDNNLVGGANDLNSIVGLSSTPAGTYKYRFLSTFNNGSVGFNCAAATTALFDNVSVRELPGNHARQSTPGARPILRQDANSRWYLEFDGTDDSLSTGTINPGSVDKAQVFLGVTRQTAADAQIVVEYSQLVSSNPGSFYVMVGTNPSTGAGNGFFTLGRGSAAFAVGQAGATPATFTPPVTAVLAGTHDIAGDLSTLRGNTVAGTNGTADKGTGNWGSYPLFIGRRGAATNFLNGRIYSLIVRFSGANLDAATISQAETWVNGKTGAY